MKHLYFIRHGESEMNVSGLFAGHTDTPLTQEGRRQAIKAGQAAKKLGIEYIFSSLLARAHDTARIVAKEIGFPETEIVLDPILMERFYGNMEGQPYSLDSHNNDFEGAETVTELLLRARQALDKIEAIDAEIILVVSHGSFGRALRHHVLEDFPFSHPLRIPNAELIQLL
ncbi:MAG: histidine phosphatase family protein [bacterium]|nr:histidine phosphatase family protein [bacterium]